MLKPMSISDLAAHLAVNLPHSKNPIDFWGSFDQSDFTRRNGFRAIWTEVASAEIILITAMEGGAVVSIDVTPSKTTQTPMDECKLADEIQDFLEDNNLFHNVWVEMNDKAIVFMSENGIDKIFATTNIGIEIITKEDDPHYYQTQMESCLGKIDGGLVEIY